jgi:hypothetical protein
MFARAINTGSTMAQSDDPPHRSGSLPAGGSDRGDAPRSPAPPARRGGVPPASAGAHRAEDRRQLSASARNGAMLRLTRVMRNR